MSKHKKRRYSVIYILLLLHRWSGISIALFVILLSITGIMLNHTEALSLTKKNINNTYILSWYGIKMPDRQLYYHVDNNWLVQIGRHIYFGQHLITKDSNKMMGTMSKNGVIIIALSNSLYLLSKEGELIEKITSEQNLPVPVDKIFTSSEGKLILKSNGFNYISEDEFLSWKKIKENIQAIDSISNNIPPPKHILNLYRNQYLGKNLPIERFILDIHSGRIVFNNGIILMDLVAIILILLILSGAFVWYKRIRRS